MSAFLNDSFRIWLSVAPLTWESHTIIGKVQTHFLYVMCISSQSDLKAFTMCRAPFLMCVWDILLTNLILRATLRVGLSMHVYQ